MQKNKQLQNLNTFHLPCEAQLYVYIKSIEQLKCLDMRMYQNAIIL